MRNGVVPVITLKANIQTTGQINQIWQLDTNTGIGANTQEPNVYLVDQVAVGDYVNYDAKSGRVEPYTYTTDSITVRPECAGKTFSSSDDVQWRVLSKNEQTGEIELMAADNLPHNLEIAYAKGYVNAEDILNTIGALYGHGKGATGGRSMKITDIERYSSYNPYTYENSYSDTGKYGGTKTYSTGDNANNKYFIDVGNKIKSKDGQSTLDEITGGEEWTEDGITYKKGSVTVRQTFYCYTASSTYFSNSDALNLIFKTANNINTNRAAYWLASRCTNLNSTCCNFFTRIVDNDEVTYARMVLSDSPYDDSNAYGVVPVVSLTSNIKTSGKNTGNVWQLNT